jgi:hypothetical protein
MEHILTLLVAFPAPRSASWSFQQQSGRVGRGGTHTRVGGEAARDVYGGDEGSVKS